MRLHSRSLNQGLGCAHGAAGQHLHDLHAPNVLLVPNCGLHEKLTCGKVELRVAAKLLGVRLIK